MYTLTVNISCTVTDHLLDLPLGLEITKRFPCERSVDLQPVYENCDSDEAVGLNIFLQLLGGILVKDDCMVGLVLNYKSNSYISLRP